MLFASLVLILLFWQWRPIPAWCGRSRAPSPARCCGPCSGPAGGIVLFSTFLISHFELFGMQQVVAALARAHRDRPGFHTPLLYKHVRHPLYLGFLMSFWAAPVMTAGHLLFAVATTGYILIAIQLEEHDLIALFGDKYRAYRREVAMLIPGLRRRAPAATSGAGTVKPAMAKPKPPSRG